MIDNPFILIFSLLIMEITVLFISSRPEFKKYFNFIPYVFWIFFLPMLISTFGLIDAKSPVLSAISTYLLPISLFLLILGVDIQAILKLGKPALFMMLVGSVGMVIGVTFTFFIFKDWVGREFWAGFGALCGSWTGGSANMIAVKEALNMADPIFLPMLIVDTIVPYIWMGMLVAAVSLQPVYDRWNHSDRRILNEIALKIEAQPGEKTDIFEIKKVVFILFLGFTASRAAAYLAEFFPVVKDVISTYAWTIILVTALAIGASFTKIRFEVGTISARVGYFILYFVLTSIGAKANLSQIGTAVILIAAGFMIALIHGLVLFSFSRLIRAPMFLAAVASQANIGGVASAPIVAEIYQPGLAPVGLLLAILGNIMGTYFGIFAASLCKWIAFF